MNPHVHTPGAEYEALVRKVESLQGEPPTTGNTESRFRELLEHGLEALSADSYGIAAAYVIRGDGFEISFIGRNTVAQGDPRGHAEMNAIGTAVDVLTQADTERTALLATLVRGGFVRVRPCAQRARQTILYSTLEPCPMCTAVAINAGVDTVIFAHEDPEAGALAPPRLARLAPLWTRTVEHLAMRIVQCQSDNPEDGESYLPPEVLALLDQLFQVTRDRLDQKLSSSSFFAPQALTKMLDTSPTDWGRLGEVTWRTRVGDRLVSRSKRVAGR
jgi:tRNA(Arg) A34 adenosine deaminase TadA